MRKAFRVVLLSLAELLLIAVVVFLLYAWWLPVHVGPTVP